MTHISLIDFYLIRKYPGIMTIKNLRGHVSDWCRAMKYLASLPEEERLFCKILRPVEETECLNRHLFAPLICAARIIATHEDVRFINYLGDEYSQAENLKVVILEYLNRNITELARVDIAYNAHNDLSQQSDDLLNAMFFNQDKPAEYREIRQ